MFDFRKAVCMAVLAVAPSVGAAQAPADNLQRVLHQLDAAAAVFHTASANFEWDTNTTEPIPDKDVQKGIVYYDRKGTAFEMAAHVHEVNGHPVPKDVIYAGGLIKLYEKMLDQVTVFKAGDHQGQYESFFMLGFGASGKDIAARWDVTYKGTETLEGIKCDVLELVSKDPTVRKTVPKVTLWIDSERGVSLKQVFEQGQGVTRVCFYFGLKVNQALPVDAFAMKTTAKTKIINR